MTTLLDESAQHLRITESAEVSGPVRADGLVPIHVIRPGVGKGKGRHLYEARMLEENAHVFKGWKMFVDHQSPEAKRAGGGLPRTVRDLGGIVKEAWWDANVPADAARGHGQGAVVALVRPTRLIRDLIECDPALVETSVSATATGVRPVQAGGQTAWLVEGFNPTGSVDWVSIAGAGGRVAQLAEALEESMTDEDWEMEVLESMNDAELIAHLRAKRPGLAKELAEAEADVNDEPDENEEVDVKESLDVLKEALETPEGRDLVEGLIAAKVREEFTRIAAPKLAELVEAALEEERELIVAEAEAKADRKVQLRDLRDTAHAQIDEARLPDTFKRELRSKYDLVEGEDGKPAPTAALDVSDDVDEKGKVTKSAGDKLTEAVTADVKAKQRQHAELDPTAVRGQGRTVTETSDEPDGEGETDADGEKKKPAAKKDDVEESTTGSELTDHLLVKAGVEINESLYEGIF